MWFSANQKTRIISLTSYILDRAVSWLPIKAYFPMNINEIMLSLYLVSFEFGLVESVSWTYWSRGGGPKWWDAGSPRLKGGPWPSGYSKEPPPPPRERGRRAALDTIPFVPWGIVCLQCNHSTGGLFGYLEFPVLPPSPKSSLEER